MMMSALGKNGVVMVMAPGRGGARSVLPGRRLGMSLLASKVNDARGTGARRWASSDKPEPKPFDRNRGPLWRDLRWDEQADADLRKKQLQETAERAHQYSTSTSPPDAIAAMNQPDSKPAEVTAHGGGTESAVGGARAAGDKKASVNSSAKYSDAKDAGGPAANSASAINGAGKNGKSEVAAAAGATQPGTTAASSVPNHASSTNTNAAATKTAPTANPDASSAKPSSTSPSDSDASSKASTSERPYNDDWEEKPDFNLQKFSQLPHVNFGVNQHMIINNDLKEVLRVLLRQFNAPIMYCFAYGSGVFPQSKPGRSVSEAEFRAVHPKPPEAVLRAQAGNPKMIDFIFGVTHTEHWHSLNMRQHRDHYSGLASLGSGLVSRVQDRYGAGVYFHPYIVVNGILIKYGVTSIDNLCNDLWTWDTLYLAGRLQKPVKILRDHPSVRLANQMNLISALRTALLLLPPDFTERDLYATVAGISYLGDPRMKFPTENPAKIANIVDNNMTMFRRLYGPLIDTLPNLDWNDPNAKTDIWLTNPEANLRLTQDMDPVKRSNMVRRLPKQFRARLYFQYQKKFALPRDEFTRMLEAAEDVDAGSGSVRRKQGGEFERRIANDDAAEMRQAVRRVIKQTIGWPSTAQSVKGVFTAGWRRTARYLREKWDKYNEGKAKAKADALKAAEKAKEDDKKSS